MTDIDEEMLARAAKAILEDRLYTTGSSPPVLAAKVLIAALRKPVEKIK